jgi:hypothetical protein
MHHRKLRNSDWRVIEKRSEKKLASWKAKHLSYGGRLVILNPVLSGLPMFMMSVFEIPKEVFKKLDQYRSRFFWQGNKDKKKYRLDKWNILCRPKDQGGLGIADLATKNIILLSKWIFNLLNGDGPWQSLLRNKYLTTKTLSHVQEKPNDSHFWKGLLKVKKKVLDCGTFNIKDGSQIRLWEDKWVGRQPFKEQYPCLYNITHYPHETVVNVMRTTPLHISFQRASVGINLNQWYNLVAKIAHIGFIK